MVIPYGFIDNVKYHKRIMFSLYILLLVISFFNKR